MEWLIEPKLSIREMMLIGGGTVCCGDRAYSGPCAFYASCSGTATLTIDKTDG
jgi:hypothetical protein